MHEVDHEKIERAVSMILEAVGEDPRVKDCFETPKRVANMYEEMFAGLHKDPKEYFKTVFHENYNEVVIVKDITFHSMCEHHLVPFLVKHTLLTYRETVSLLV